MDITLRDPRPGDLGWIVHRHGALYAAEHGWDERFEGLVAEVVAEFVRSHDRARERCIIAERGGEVVGSVMIVAATPLTAKLRLLLVEPSARGTGLGRRLVDEGIAFAESRGYRNMVLWTHDTLTAARRIYEAAGFRLVAEEGGTMFGPPTVAQSWERELAPRAAATAHPE